MCTPSNRQVVAALLIRVDSHISIEVRPVLVLEGEWGPSNPRLRDDGMSIGMGISDCPFSELSICWKEVSRLMR